MALKYMVRVSLVCKFKRLIPYIECSNIYFCGIMVYIATQPVINSHSIQIYSLLNYCIHLVFFIIKLLGKHALTVVKGKTG